MSVSQPPMSFSVPVPPPRPGPRPSQLSISSPVAVPFSQPIAQPNVALVSSAPPPQPQSLEPLPDLSLPLSANYDASAILELSKEEQQSLSDEFLAHQRLFGFQSANVRNQYEHLCFLIQNARDRYGEQAYAYLHARLFSNYRRWVNHVNAQRWCFQKRIRHHFTDARYGDQQQAAGPGVVAAHLGRGGQLPPHARVPLLPLLPHVPGARSSDRERPAAHRPQPRRVVPAPRGRARLQHRAGHDAVPAQQRHTQGPRAAARTTTTSTSTSGTDAGWTRARTITTRTHSTSGATSFSSRPSTSTPRPACPPCHRRRAATRRADAEGPAAAYDEDIHRAPHMAQPLPLVRSHRRTARVRTAHTARVGVGLAGQHGPYPVLECADAGRPGRAE